MTNIVGSPVFSASAAGYRTRRAVSADRRAAQMASCVALNAGLGGNVGSGHAGSGWSSCFRSIHVAAAVPAEDVAAGAVSA